MSLKDLFTTLNFLEDNRLLGIEADAKLDPFRDQHYALGLIYDESSRTIGTRFDRAYEQGYTLVCKLEEDDRLEVTVLMLPEDNDKVDALSTGDVFEANLKVLDYDTLYQRPVFGQVVLEGATTEPKAVPPNPSEATITQEPEQLTEPEPEPEPQPEPQPQPQPEPEAEPQPQPQQQPEQAPPAQELPPTKAKPKPRRKKAAKPQRSRSRKKDTGPRLRRIKKLKDKLSMTRAKECPNGHGPIENRFGLMQCAVCGWSPKTSFQGLPEPGKNDEQEGCVQTGKIIFWLFILFIVVKSCT